MQIDPIVIFKAFFSPLFFEICLMLIIFIFVRAYLGRKINAWLKSKSDQNRMRKFSKFGNMNGVGDSECPKCGSRLVLRTARKGANAGNDFLGCSNFPTCRYMKTLK
jgi:hypothetical protein